MAKFQAMIELDHAKVAFGVHLNTSSILQVRRAHNIQHTENSLKSKTCKYIFIISITSVNSHILLVHVMSVGLGFCVLYFTCITPSLLV